MVPIAIKRIAGGNAMFVIVGLLCLATTIAEATCNSSWSMSMTTPRNAHEGPTSCDLQEELYFELGEVPIEQCADHIVHEYT